MTCFFICPCRRQFAQLREFVTHVREHDPVRLKVKRFGKVSHGARGWYRGCHCLECREDARDYLKEYPRRTVA